MAVELYCGELDVTTCDAKFITDVFAQAGHYVKMVRAHARQAAEVRECASGSIRLVHLVALTSPM